jgi:hypothetical protein
LSELNERRLQLKKEGKSYREEEEELVEVTSETTCLAYSKEKV